MQEKQDQKVAFISFSIHINLENEEHKSLNPEFFFIIFFFTFPSSLKFSQQPYNYKRNQTLQSPIWLNFQ